MQNAQCPDCVLFLTDRQTGHLSSLPDPADATRRVGSSTVSYSIIISKNTDKREMHPAIGKSTPDKLPPKSTAK